INQSHLVGHSVFELSLKVGLYILTLYLSLSFFKMPYNVPQLQEVGDFGDENCLPPLNLIRSTKLHLPIVPPISCRCCYAVGFLILSVVSLSFTAICQSMDF